MSEEFKQEVLAAYLKLKHDYQLPPELENLSPAKLRDDCFRLWIKRPLPKDKDSLKDFFNPTNDQEDLETSIKKVDVDKFRSFIKFVNEDGKLKRTKEQNIALLAWLIEFEPRPYTEWRRIRKGVNSYFGDTEGNQQEEPPVDSENIEEKNPTKGGMHSPTNKNNNTTANTNNQPTVIVDSFGRSPKQKSPVLLLSLLGAIILAIGALLYYEYLYKGCMFWKEDHFECVSCKAETGDTTVIALDSYRLKHFRKITRPDTITEYSIGRLWYLKTDGKYEFFSTGGYHPIHIERRLFPLSEYMYENLFRNKQPLP